MKTKIVVHRYILLLLFIPCFLSCEKVETGLRDIRYEPEETRQFGDETAIVQELSFKTDRFSIVGDLRRPTVGDLHPVIIMVHGSGDATRNGAVWFEPLIEIFLRNGYAVLSWDKPGSGESEGEFDSEYIITERAQLIVDAVQVLTENSNIDFTRIGLWGISQAGWVMPKALELSADIAFVIVVSGGGEDSIEQYAYQVAQMVGCQGGSENEMQQVEQYWSQMCKAESYEVYREAAEILVDIPGVVAYTGLTVSEEIGWAPWPKETDLFFNPMDVIEQTYIPILAFFGGNDIYIDPEQGREAYESAFTITGNEDSGVVYIEEASHVMTFAETGCPGEQGGSQYLSEYLETLESWLIVMN